jgi:lipopolysaccharide/colanic/teichoic acid biosynthesis glycosyltransferase
MSGTSTAALCIECGGELEPGLAVFGSIRCHDCRYGARHTNGGSAHQTTTAAKPVHHRVSGRRLGLLMFAVCDRIGAAALLLLLTPVIVMVALAIRIDTPGPVFFRCRRVGRGGREFGMLKFRKMHVGASGSALTAPDDARFTRLGAFLARTKLDEIPQLWNVLRGEMSFVGPRPEDPGFVACAEEAYEEILRVKPGITGLSQLAFAREIDILDAGDRVEHYLRRVLPQKANLDRLYVRRRSLRMNLSILLWTAVVVLLKREVAVHRSDGKLNLRRRPSVPAFGAAQGGVGA